VIRAAPRVPFQEEGRIVVAPAAPSAAVRILASRRDLPRATLLRLYRAVGEAADRGGVGPLVDVRLRCGRRSSPPTAEVGAVYQGKVVNITKFGAFVNILPGRDGLVHISKLGGGKRIDKVEDVLELGQEIEVVVEDVDPNGKISLKPTGDAPQREERRSEKRAEAAPAEAAPAEAADSDDEAEEAPFDDAGSDVSDDADNGEVVEASFEDAFASELEAVHGELGNPAPAHRGGGGGRRRGR